MKREAGNALFLILIAVALFAALSYAVTSSGRGGGGIDKEQASILAARISQYSGLVGQAVTRLKMINGCSDTEISFHYDSDGDGTLENDGSDDYYNVNSVTNTSCYVFNPDGGGLSFETLESVAFDTVCPGGFWCSNFVFTGDSAVPGVGTAENELVVFLSDITEEICVELNRNFNGTSTIPNSGFWVNKFTGTYPAITTMTVPSGQMSGCFTAGAPAYYVFYNVLIAR